MGKNGGLTQLASWQHRVWRTLQVEKPEDPWTRGLVSFLTVLIIASVATVVLETVSWLAERFAIWFLTIEVIAVATFTVEFLLGYGLVRKRRGTVILSLVGYYSSSRRWPSWTYWPFFRFT
ncbi:MAG: hypothetical protein RMJ82_06775 [Gemmatales bacterium]|nr:hypothetical protein [Gemmatales bacterium]